MNGVWRASVSDGFERNRSSFSVPEAITRQWAATLRTATRRDRQAEVALKHASYMGERGSCARDFTHGLARLVCLSRCCQVVNDRAGPAHPRGLIDVNDPTEFFTPAPKSRTGARGILRLRVSVTRGCVQKRWRNLTTEAKFTRG